LVVTSYEKEKVGTYQLTVQPVTARVLEGHGDAVNGIAFSPDDRQLTSASDDGTVYLWDVSSQQPALLLEDQGELQKGATLVDRGTYFREHSFSAEVGQRVFIRLASQDFDTSLRLINPAGEVVAENDDRFGTENSAIAITLNQPGPYRLVVTSYEKEEVGNYRLTVQPVTPRVLEGYAGRINGVAFSPDGQQLASTNQDGTTHVWNLPDNTIRVLEGHSEEVTAVSFSNDGKTLGTTSRDDTARLWNLATPDQEGVSLLETQGQLVSSDRVLPDRGTYYAEHSLSVTTGQEVIVRLESEDFDPYLQLMNSAGEVIAENDDSFGSNSGIVWKLDQGGSYRLVVTSYAKEKVGAYRLSVKTFVDEAEVVLTGHGRHVRSLSFNPTDPDQVITASEDATLKRWNLRGELLQTLVGHTNYVNGLSFSPDGNLIASGGGDDTVKLWQRWEQTLQTLTGHTDWVYSVAFSPDGQRLVSGSRDNTLWLWDANTGQPIGAPLTGHTNTG
jgi:WD40 repeat protein